MKSNRNKWWMLINAVLILLSGLQACFFITFFLLYMYAVKKEYRYKTKIAFLMTVLGFTVGLTALWGHFVYHEHPGSFFWQFSQSETLSTLLQKIPFLSQSIQPPKTMESISEGGDAEVLHAKQKLSFPYMHKCNNTVFSVNQKEVFKKIRRNRRSWLFTVNAGDNVFVRSLFIPVFMDVLFPGPYFQCYLYGKIQSQMDMVCIWNTHRWFFGHFRLAQNIGDSRQNSARKDWQIC